MKGMAHFNTSTNGHLLNKCKIIFYELVSFYRKANLNNNFPHRIVVFELKFQDDSHY